MNKVLSLIISCICMSLVLLTAKMLFALPMTGGKLTKVTVAEFRGITWCAAYVAKELGFYEQEGLDVSFAKYTDGPIAFQGMHRNDSQFCLMSQEPVLKATLEGLHSKLIYTVLDTRVFGFATAKEINSINDLKGKLVFAGMPGSAPYSFVSSILREAGLNPEKEVTFVNMDYGASLTALSVGQIQATYVNIDTHAEVENMDVNFLVDTSKPNDAAKYLKTPVFPSEIIVTTSVFAEENPETVQAFINAYHKATLWMHNNSAENIAAVIAPYYPGLNEETLKSKIDVLKTVLTRTGYIGRNEEDYVLQYCINNGVIDTMIPYEEIVDMSFVEGLPMNE